MQANRIYVIAPSIPISLFVHCCRNTFPKGNSITATKMIENLSYTMTVPEKFVTSNQKQKHRRCVNNNNHTASSPIYFVRERAIDVHFPSYTFVVAENIFEM